MSQLTYLAGCFAVTLSLAMPSPFQLRRLHLSAGTPGSEEPFVGLLDDFVDGLEGSWSVAKRLLKSYKGQLITVRRTSDDEEVDIGAGITGGLDIATLADFVGDSGWHVRRVYDQSGHGRHLQQNATVAQPQGGLDEHGLAHAFNPYTNIGVVEMTVTDLSLAIQATTQWAVGSAASYASDLMTIRGANSRRLTNFSNGIILDIPGGVTPFISGTSTELHSLVGQFGITSRLHTGLATAVGGASAPADVATFFSAGNFGGGPNWSQNSRWYAGAVWSADLGDTLVDDLQVQAQLLFIS